jgi:hypothetical protein
VGLETCSESRHCKSELVGCEPCGYVPYAHSLLLTSSSACFNSGVLIGVNAALISILAEWLSDIKMGYCKDGWWLNQEFCCWENMTDEEIGCNSWVPWSRFAVLQWFIYVLCAVSASTLLVPDWLIDSNCINRPCFLSRQHTLCGPLRGTPQARVSRR